MNISDETKTEVCMELIASLQRENNIQSQLIESQKEIIRALEEHNARLEDIISKMSTI